MGGKQELRNFTTVVHHSVRKVGLTGRGGRWCGCFTVRNRIVVRGCEVAESIRYNLYIFLQTEQ